jgi:hypothetical protein
MLFPFAIKFPVRAYGASGTPSPRSGVHPAARSRLQTGKTARNRVLDHSGGVYVFFDFVEKNIHPILKGSVREPGSLTHPQGTPADLLLPQESVGKQPSFFCPDLCVFTPLREALPGQDRQSLQTATMVWYSSPSLSKYDTL